MSHIDNNEFHAPKYRIEFITNVHKETREWVSVSRNGKPTYENLKHWVDLYNECCSADGSNFSYSEAYKKSGKIVDTEFVHITDAFIINQETDKVEVCYNINDVKHSISCSHCENLATCYVANIVVINVVPLDSEGERDYTLADETCTQEENNGEYLCKSCADKRINLK